MKRPPGLWCLLIIATFWLCIQDVNSLRATALILGKLPSTTTTTTEAPQEIDGQEVITESSVPEETQNVTKPVLTGNPQIDYIWDPNLPRELNGYNLSEYPFYDGLPDDITFKCDGLHDGFYASVPHKCQVYHHCLFGVRYDFLCANYTAFDQKTFICHFVSEVDCVNSKKFWHRNDALYKAATTTTVKPTVIVTQPPAPVTSVPITPILNRRPGATGPGRGFRYRKPPKRYEYYDDDYVEEEYEERRYQKRPLYRRPVYEDDYEEYEDEVYSKRRPSRRRPERRGQSRRNKEDRRRYEDDEDYDRDVEDSRDDEEMRRPNRKRRPNKRRPAEDEDYDRRYERPQKRTRRPIDDDDYDDEAPRRNRKKNRNRDSDVDKETEDRPKKNKSDERPRSNRNEERSRSNDDKPKPKQPEIKAKSDVSTEEPPLTKAPLSVYERKRPPKIRPPVPLNEQSKYAPKTTTSSPIEYEYYDDYEEEEIVRDTKRTQDRSQERTQDRNQERNQDRNQDRYQDKNQERTPISRKPERKAPPNRSYFNKPKSSEYDDEEVYKRPTTTKRPLNSKDRRLGSGSRRRPVIEEYEDYEENSSKSTEEPTTTTTIKETVKDIVTDTIKEKQEPIVKVVKRPFLPSRGGNPYAARGLHPIGLKSEEVVSAKFNPPLKEQENFQDQPDETQKSKPLLKLKTKSEEDFKPITNRPVSRINIVKITTTTTTEKPIEKNPLDLDENEYDVTLNDALNPTIPNLPIRNFPTGFSSQNDYNYNAVQRNRYVAADPTLNQASSDYVYRIEPLQSSRYVPVYQTFRQTPRQQQSFYAGY